MSYSIIQGDCLEVLETIGPGTIDAVVTDPPFAFAGAASNGRSDTANPQFFVHWLEDLFTRLHRVCTREAPWFIWADWRSIGCYDEALRRAIRGAACWRTPRSVSQVLIHDRMSYGMGSPFRNQADWIAVVKTDRTDLRQRVTTTQSNIIRLPHPYVARPHHPAQKSVDLARLLVGWACDPGCHVLDPFAGSATVGVACRLEGRRYTGIESDPYYCDIARNRLEEGKGSPSLFDLVEQ